MSLMNPAGGLYYHARAWRYRRLWQPFREEVAAWLGTWNPTSRKLLLIGPSAGYVLPTSWLAEFDEIVAVDIDSLAPLFFAQQHHLSNVRWLNEDILPMATAGPGLGKINRLLAEHRDYAVLFTNVLGQVECFAKTTAQADKVEDFMGRLRILLASREWASFHDRLSGECVPEVEDVTGDHSHDYALATRVYRRSGFATHRTERLGDGLKCHLMTWQRVPGYWHVVEGCIGKPVAQVVVSRNTSEALRTA